MKGILGLKRFLGVSIYVAIGVNSYGAKFAGNFEEGKIVLGSFGSG